MGTELIVHSFQLNRRIIPKLFDDPIKGSCSGDNSFGGEVLAVVHQENAHCPQDGSGLHKAL